MAQSGVDVLLEAVSPSEATVVAMPGCIAVFGGSLTTSEQLPSEAPPSSLRDAFVKWVRANRIDWTKQLLLPENYEDWNNFDVYSDLLFFEEDLGYVTSAVVIFLEAPGAIAELAAFSQIESLKDQLVVVVFDSHHPKKSFISLGPLLQIEGRDKNAVCVIPQRNLAEFEQDIEIIVSAIESKIACNRSGRQINFSAKNHQIVLALDAITLLEATTFGDIKKVYEHFSCSIPDNRIRQIIFTLEKAGLIRSRRYGGTMFYGPSNRGKTWVDYKGPELERPFNRSRVSAKIAASRDTKSAAGKALSLMYEADKHD